ncbi:tetratricopeptide repeat protein [Oceanicaulis sp. LC35]|uniref:tetratricopeptide repeat protein n=1 Tax=Oceanicaulis sp. LC35 TaxID=3349635 RepID=UPI003F86DAEC
MMIQVLTASALAALTCSAAQAELRDVSVLQEAGRTQLWLSFDEQPQAVEVLPGEGLVLHVDGVSAEGSRRIEPAVRGPVSALALSRAPNGVSISVSGAFSRGEAEVRQGGVLVTLLNVTGVSTPITRTPPRTHATEQSHTASTAPATQPAHAAPSSDHSAPASAHGSDAGHASSVSAATSHAQPAHADAGHGAAASSDSHATSAHEPATGQPLELGGDVVIDESVCPDSAARLADAPWDLNLLSTHADCLVSMGDSEGAVALYQRVLAFDPRHFQAALGLARILSDQGDHQAAAELFDTAASAARTDGQAVQARMAARRARELAGSGGQ